LLVKPLSLRGRQQPAASSLKEGQTYAAFQGAYGRRRCRLRHAQYPCRTGDRSIGHDRPEYFELPQAEHEGRTSHKPNLWIARVMLRVQMERALFGTLSQ